MVTKPSSSVPISYSIPHKRWFTQARLSNLSNQIDTFGLIDSPPPPGLESDVQQQAYKLYDIGFNVFPQPHGKKAGLPWKNLQYERIERDHSKYGLHILFAGTCNIAVMCGKTSGNLFVIDCETPETFAHNLHQMRQRGLNIWASKSGRGGHIYLRSKNGEVCNIDTGTIPDVEIKGNKRYVIAPPSIHPSGAVYEWLLQEGASVPEVDIRQINWLTDTREQPVKLKIDQPPKSDRTRSLRLTSTNNDKHLSYLTQDYLRNGHIIPEGSRNNRLFSAACDLNGNGYSDEQAEAILLPIAKDSGLRESEIRNTIASAFNQYREPARKTQNNTSFKPLWKDALSFCLHHNWTGRSANSQRSLFLTLVSRARINSDSEGIFRASMRELSTKARIGIATTQRVIKQLLKAGLIERGGHDKSSGASLWKFGNSVIKEGHRLKTDTVSPPPWFKDNVSIFDSSDVSERGALGHGGMLVYRSLLGLKKPMMPKALAECINIRVHQVHYALSKLKKYGLVRRLSDGWLAIKKTDDELNQYVAVPAGTSGKGEARRRRYARERRIYIGSLIFRARVRFEGEVFKRAFVSSYMAHVSSLEEQKLRASAELHGASVSVPGATECDPEEEWLYDPLVQLGIELGGVVEWVDGRGEVRFYPPRSDPDLLL